MSAKVLGAKPRKRTPDFQDFADGFFLVGDGGDHEIRSNCCDLLGVGSPGIGKDHARVGGESGTTSAQYLVHATTR